MSSNSKTKQLMIIAFAIAALFLIGFGVMGYMYNNSSKEASKLNSELKSFKKQSEEEKQELLTELDQQKQEYEALKLENEELRAELDAKILEIEELMAEIEKQKGIVSYLYKFKKRVKNSEEELNTMKSQFEVLQSENSQLKSQLSSATSENTSLTASVEEKNTLIQQGSEIRVVSPTLTPMMLKGKRLAKSVRKADYLNLCFTIPANPIAENSSDWYYVLVYDHEGALISNKKETTRINGENITSTFSEKLTYIKREINYCKKLYQKKFEKGKYRIQIYNQDKLLKEQTFTLN